MDDKFTLTELPIELKRPFMKQFDDFKSNKISKWKCFVCSNFFYTDEEITHHTRDVHGVMFREIKGDMGK